VSSADIVRLDAILETTEERSDNGPPPP